MSATTLPPLHRRLRHVVHIACRNVPVARAARHSGVAFQFVLRLVAPGGGPGDVIYESEVIAGTLHPVWTSLPQQLTQSQHPNLQRFVFSLYLLEPHDTDAPHTGGSVSATSVLPLLHEAVEEDGDTKPQSTNADGMPASPAAACNSGSTTSNESPAWPQGDDTDKSRHLADSVRGSPSIKTTDGGSAASSKKDRGTDSSNCSTITSKLVFEFLLDLAHTDYVAKSITALCDVPQIPAHIEDGPRSFSILLKCTDGVFFPTMEGSSSAEFDITRPMPSVKVMVPSSALQALQNAAATGSFLQSTSATQADWDMVDDVDALRQMWDRAQGAGRMESMTYGDLKALAASSIALRRLDDCGYEALQKRLQRIDELVKAEELNTAQHAAAFVSQYVEDSCRRRIAQKRVELEQLRVRLAAKRSQIEAQRAKLLEKTEVLRASPSQLFLECDESASTLRAALVEQLTEARSQFVREAASCFPIDSQNGTVCGFRLPAADSTGLPETPEHAMAISNVCHLLIVVCRAHRVALPHPIQLAPGRCRIFERHGVTDERSYSLYPGKSSDRPSVRRGMDLLKQNIVSAAYHIHQQKQAEGLPLVVAMEKLVSGR